MYSLLFTVVLYLLENYSEENAFKFLVESTSHLVVSRVVL